ncbi:hypothetical protein D3C72_2169580 [compost metagenome]
MRKLQPICCESRKPWRAISVSSNATLSSLMKLAISPGFEKSVNVASRVQWATGMSRAARWRRLSHAISADRAVPPLQ